MTDGNVSGSSSDGDSKSPDWEKEEKEWVSVGKGKTKKQRVQEKKKKYRERKKDEAKMDEAKMDEAKMDEAKMDEAKMDEAKMDEAKKDEAKKEESENAWMMKHLEEYTRVVKHKMSLQMRMVMVEGGNTQEYLQWLETNAANEFREKMPEDQVMFMIGVLRNAGAFDLTSYLTPSLSH
jgi:hypothetical protein